jgi:hypothetical protein
MKESAYSEFLAEREELFRHKWIMSERAKSDVGFEKALVDWAVNHRSPWRKQRNKALKVGDKSAKGS